MISILDVEELKRPLLINILALYNDRKVKLENIGSFTCLNVDGRIVYLTVEESFLDSLNPQQYSGIVDSTIQYLITQLDFNESDIS
jgi:hypothetical protein